MVFVYKDYNREVKKVSIIPSEDLETVKNWLDSVDLLFSESAVNFNWENLLGSVCQDLKKFIFEDNSWSFLFEDVNI